MLKDFLRSVWPFYAGAAALILVFGCLGSLSFVLGFFLLFLGVPAVVLALAMWTVVSIFRAVAWARDAPGRISAVIAIVASPVFLVLTFLASWPMLVAGRHLGQLLELAINHQEYEEIVHAARGSVRNDRSDNEDGVTYVTDLGPPMRVAFNPEGIGDNWSAIVFDPTGRVMEADGFDPETGKFAADREITELFGGDLVSCRHLWSAYYACSFT